MSIAGEHEAKGFGYPVSILDTDLYKLTMQQAVLKHFPDQQATYRFTNRSKGMKFTRQCADLIQERVAHFENVHLKPSELEFLRDKCPYLSDAYVAYLGQYRFRPSEQVSVRFVPDEGEEELGQVEINVRGLWVETILYEVPLMSIVSESYFNSVDKDWEDEGQEELAFEKGRQLFQAGVALSEFGSRRRRSYGTQETIIRGLIRANQNFGDKSGGGILVGTSNVHFAHKFGIKPVGTFAHEWPMGIAAIYRYERANTIALQIWEDVYPGEQFNALHIALPDTFTTDAFYKYVFEADPSVARRWRGLRQDSGDPETFARRAKDVYQSLGIDWKTKTIMFSDGLDVEKCIHLDKVAKGLGFIPAFGVGTSLTNDFKKKSDKRETSKPLNIVIKLVEMDGKPCIKISDDISKVTGDKKAVEEARSALGI
ncbi:hypothetical protein BOTBODRAFT_33453 [Botryobasidium botryosum FD-172 SS1]|uniref:Nicotinate phosphoribosyltransferase n=1 Tax=Botryobasidium botryosum (strain FD-172 SS1) TaxID=930990 RepID=A0A067MNI7_BOTB1|nr:hypothetical protein BOTBODRAFT_33453 [Botryobasidium botryosum FD-172 SS1]